MNLLAKAATALERAEAGLMRLSECTSDIELSDVDVEIRNALQIAMGNIALYDRDSRHQDKKEKIASQEERAVLEKKIESFNGRFAVARALTNKKLSFKT